MKNNICPDCECSLLESEELCSCGWKSPERSKIRSTDYRCQYSFEERRCLAMGTVSASIRNDVWLCMDHWLTRNNPERAKVILDRNEKN